MKPKQEDPKEMVGGCCVCSDENGWTENPLVYCDGQGCNVAVHQACYGIVTVPTGSWFCRKCESQERAARVRCELCPSKDGALKRTDSGGWAHVVCALYIPEVRFGNVTTMEPIMLQLIPQERFNKSCYLCDETQRGSKATIGACMQCNRAGCKNHFHVTCAQAMGLLCEEAGNYLDNVKYCGYCQYHYNKLRRGSHVKTIPPYRPVAHDSVSSDEEKLTDSKDLKLKKRLSSSKSPVHDAVGASSGTLKQQQQQQLSREIKVNLSELSSKGGSVSLAVEGAISQDSGLSSGFSLSAVPNSRAIVGLKVDPKTSEGVNPPLLSNSSNIVSNSGGVTSGVTKTSFFPSTSGGPGGLVSSDPKTITVTSVTFPTTSPPISSLSVNLSMTSLLSTVSSSEATTVTPLGGDSTLSDSGLTHSSATYTPSSSSGSMSSSGNETVVTSVVSSSVSTIVTLPSAKLRTVTSSGGHIITSSSSSHHHHHHHHHHSQQQQTPTSVVGGDKDSKEKHHRNKLRRNGPRSSGSGTSSGELGPDPEMMQGEGGDNQSIKEAVLTICEERNLSSVEREKSQSSKGQQGTFDDTKLNVQYTPNVSNQGHKSDVIHSMGIEGGSLEPSKRSRSNSQDRGRRSKRGTSGGGGSISKRGRVSLASKENIKDSRDSGPSSPESLSPKRGGRSVKHENKEQKEPTTLNSVITNGLAANALLLGNQINPASAVAQKMTDTLNSELEAHSIYKDEEKVNTSLVGPALPGKRETSTPGILSSTQPPPLPQNLEQLLERQWEQGSQFLMEQAQHFDIASLLSCLHQLRQENVRLEETVNSLVARRDHLLAVNARLSVPLGSNSGGGGSGANSVLSQPPLQSSLSASSSVASSVSITPAISSSLVGGGAPPLPGGHVASTPSSAPAMPHSASPAALIPSRGHSQHQRHPSGGSTHTPVGSAPGSLSGRGASPHDRKVSSHQGAPLENGLGEPEYRYRSPSTDHQHRQQSPMLPPGAQPSPTSMRQSPASSGYHSGSSPHAGVPSLSPSGVSHPPAPPTHTLVSHGHPPVMSSSHGAPAHSVALSRPSGEHSRAELVRLASTQPHSSSAVGYPVYQMVSPPVPGPHHSPVSMSQHPSHSQVVRREVESGRSSHSLEKR